MKILFVINRNWWEKKCPPFWPEQYYSIAKQPGVTALITGPGWGTWRENKSLRYNVEQLMPEADVVYLWRPFGIVEFKGIIGAEATLKQLKVSAYQDDPKFSLNEAKRANLDLVFYHDHWDRQFYENSGIQIEYLPLAVNLEHYGGWRKKIPERKWDTLLHGNLSATTYPLRDRFKRLLDRKRIPGRVRPSQGYRMRDLKSCFVESKRYANALMDSKISLVSTCPHIPLTLRKYFESMAAGCVVVGDMPHSPPEDVRECINVVTRNMSDTQILQVIRRLLSNPEECERQRVRNRQVAERYGYSHFAKRWVEVVGNKLKEREACTSTL